MQNQGQAGGVGAINVENNPELVDAVESKAIDLTNDQPFPAFEGFDHIATIYNHLEGYGFLTEFLISPWMFISVSMLYILGNLKKQETAFDQFSVPKMLSKLGLTPDQVNKEEIDREMAQILDDLFVHFSHVDGQVGNTNNADVELGVVIGTNGRMQLKVQPDSRLSPTWKLTSENSHFKGVSIDPSSSSSDNLTRAAVVVNDKGFWVWAKAKLNDGWKELIHYAVGYWIIWFSVHVLLSAALISSIPAVVLTSILFGGPIVFRLVAPFLFRCISTAWRWLKLNISGWAGWSHGAENSKKLPSQTDMVGGVVSSLKDTVDANVDSISAFYNKDYTDFLSVVLQSGYIDNRELADIVKTSIFHIVFLRQYKALAVSVIDGMQAEKTDVAGNAEHAKEHAEDADESLANENSDVAQGQTSAYALKDAVDVLKNSAVGFRGVIARINAGLGGFTTVGFVMWPVTALLMIFLPAAVAVTVGPQLVIVTLVCSFLKGVYDAIVEGNEKIAKLEKNRDFGMSQVVGNMLSELSKLAAKFEPKSAVVSISSDNNLASSDTVDSFTNPSDPIDRDEYLRKCSINRGRWNKFTTFLARFFTAVPVLVAGLAAISTIVKLFLLEETIGAMIFGVLGLNPLMLGSVAIVALGVGTVWAALKFVDLCMQRDEDNAKYAILNAPSVFAAQQVNAGIQQELESLSEEQRQIYPPVMADISKHGKNSLVPETRDNNVAASIVKYRNGIVPPTSANSDCQPLLGVQMDVVQRA